MLNKVMAIGNLGADPEMRYLESGAAVTEFRIASNRQWKDKDGNKQEEVEWFRVVTWNKLAEVCSQYLSKGRQVYVEGRLRTRSWEGQDGVTRYTTEVIAHEVKFLGGRTDQQGEGAAPTSSGAEPTPPQARSDIEPDDMPF